MRLKTFLMSYLVLISVLFITVSSISIYMVNNQLAMTRERSMREYQTISASLARDMAAMLGRSGMDTIQSIAIDSLVNTYAIFYQEHQIEISLIDIGEEKKSDEIEMTLIEKEGSHFVSITGLLPHPFQAYSLKANFDISENVASMENIQNTLLILFSITSALSAIVLHLTFKKIFTPLEIVASASKKIANGKYHERIIIEGEGELLAVAEDFNKMAEEIEYQIEKLEEEALGKQQFVDNFAHEIRTPLTSIYGYAEYMQKARLEEEELIEMTQYIMDEAIHMKNIANSLLELATLKNFTPVKNKVFLPKLFEEIQKTLKKSLDEENVKLIITTHIDFLDVQEDLLRSLLLNLCSNALKSCTYGEGIIRLDASKIAERIVLSVTDDGHGIPKESLDRVIEPFYRVDKARSREFGGAGLGLALCHQIAEIFNAQLVIESEVGSGTQIKLIFTTS